MSKALCKAIMKLSKRRNTFSKKKSSENRQNYKLKCNICLKILKLTKNLFSQNLNVNKKTNTKKF